MSGSRKIVTLLLICCNFLLGAIVLSGCLNNSAGASPTPIPTFTPQPTASPTSTATVTHTPTRTRTPSPSETVTPAITPTGTGTITPFPTLTAAVPFFESFRYELAEWGPARASRLINLMENYPNTVFKDPRGKAYFKAFRYAALVELEGALRFSEIQEAKTWRWKAAYNLARSGDRQTGSMYRSLIEAALLDGEADPDELNAWFGAREPRLSLRPIELDPLAGFQRMFLVELRGPGSAFFLILEAAGKFQVWELSTHFNFADPIGYDFAVGDLDGDGIREIAIFPTEARSDRELERPQVFSLRNLPPQVLEYRPAEDLHFGLDLVQRWSIRPNDEGFNDLVFQSRVFPACPVDITARFRWDGTSIRTMEISYELTAREELLEFCGPNLDHAVSVWGLDAVLQLMEPDLAARAADPASPYPSPGLKDKWRLRLGIYHGLVGDFEGARAILQALAAKPQAEREGWSKLAKDFLERYQAPADLYRACEVTDLCDLQLALKQQIESIPVSEYNLVIDRLGRQGIPVRASGFFDFAGDGQLLRWLTVRHPNRILLELWLTVPGPGHIHAVHIETIDTDVPVFTAIVDRGRQLAVQLFNQKTFSLVRLPDTQLPYLQSYSPGGLFALERVQLEVQAAMEGLLRGDNPASIRRDLLDLKASPTFICLYTTCPDFIYALALANELAGDGAAAVEGYHEIWLFYDDSPYVIPARLKLAGEALLPTATPTRTRTPTPTRTETPTPNLSATITPTVTISPTTTPTLDVTPP